MLRLINREIVHVKSLNLTSPVSRPDYGIRLVFEGERRSPYGYQVANASGAGQRRPFRGGLAEHPGFARSPLMHARRSC